MVRPAPRVLHGPGIIVDRRDAQPVDLARILLLEPGVARQLQRVAVDRLEAESARFARLGVLVEADHHLVEVFGGVLPDLLGRIAERDWIARRRVGCIGPDRQLEIVGLSRRRHLTAFAWLIAIADIGAPPDDARHGGGAVALPVIGHQTAIGRAGASLLRFDREGQIDRPRRERVSLRIEQLLPGAAISLLGLHPDRRVVPMVGGSLPSETRRDTAGSLQHIRLRAEPVHHRPARRSGLYERVPRVDREVVPVNRHVAGRLIRLVARAVEALRPGVERFDHELAG